MPLEIFTGLKGFQIEEYRKQSILCNTYQQTETIEWITENYQMKESKTNLSTARSNSVHPSPSVGRVRIYYTQFSLAPLSMTFTVPVAFEFATKNR